MADEITLRGLNRATLARQLLLERRKLKVPAAVDRLAGMQAQEAKPPFVGLWTRLDGFERDDLLKPLRSRALVRATWLRATLHLVSAADYLAFRGTLDPMLAGGSRGFGDGVPLDELLPVARKLLKGEPKNFNRLRELLSEAFPEINERAMGYLVRLRLPLVMVATGDPWGYPQTADFTLAGEWLDRDPDMAPDPEALRELVRRYLAAFGPATAADMQRWSGLGGIAAVVKELGDELVPLKYGRRTMYDLPDAPRPDEDTPAPVRFLPGFDNLVLAHDDRSRVVPDAHRGRITTKNLRVNPTVLVDGTAAATWAIERKGKAATLTVDPFERLPKGAKGEIEAEAEALLAFAEDGAATRNVKVAAPS
jgi:hypothetical protein